MRPLIWIITEGVLSITCPSWLSPRKPGISWLRYGIWCYDEEKEDGEEDEDSEKEEFDEEKNEGIEGEDGKPEAIGEGEE